VAKLSDLRPDASNANKGTERGRYALEASLRKFGAGRSVLADRNLRLIAGNKTVETAADVGIDDVIIVPTDGTKLVVVQRTDLDIDSPEGRGLAYADNRTGELDINFDGAQIALDVADGLDLSAFWFDWEIDKLTGDAQEEENDHAAVWQDMPEFVQDDLEAWKSLKVNFANEQALAKFAALVEQTVTNDTRSIWFPKKEKADLTKYKVLDES
jgi:hypothetical protein